MYPRNHLSYVENLMQVSQCRTSVRPPLRVRCPTSTSPCFWSCRETTLTSCIQMMFSLPTEPYELNPVKVRALELFLILHVRPPHNDQSYACAEWTSYLGLPFATICCIVAVSCAAVAIQAATAAAVHESCWHLLGRCAPP